MAEAKAVHRPASQVLRDLTREYDDYLRRKVETARASMHTGVGRTNDEVEAEFAARRAQVTGQP